MRKDYLSIAGRSVRVEVNWNAVVSFLESEGRNDLQSLADIKSIKPSDFAGMLAAAANEGERLEGREANYTASDIGSAPDSMGLIAAFLDIFIRQTTPQTEPQKEEGKE